MKHLILLMCLIPFLGRAADIKRDNLRATEYFSLFDYQEREKIKSILSFEKKLINHALWIE
ncbi:MAG: hypothetical protein H0V66_06515, partial [Bdellovibrionales bacterium]|nr:hypothetical protein [Bdellovibrionales bacterium]